jgi:hypothetical protein
MRIVLTYVEVSRMLKYSKFVNFNTGRSNHNHRKAPRPVSAPQPLQEQPRHEAISSTYVEVYLPEPEYVPMPAYLEDLFATTLPEDVSAVEEPVPPLETLYSELTQGTDESAREIMLPQPVKPASFAISKPAQTLPAVIYQHANYKHSYQHAKIEGASRVPICLPGPREDHRRTPSLNDLLKETEPSLDDIFQQMLADQQDCLFRW